MPNLSSIKQRISSVKKVVKVTNIVKLIATSKLHSAKNSAIYSEHFFKEAQGIFNSLFPHTKLKQLKDENREVDILKSILKKDDSSKQSVDSLVFVAMGSNRGLCGNLNASVAKMLINTVDSKIKQNPNIKIKIYSIGKQMSATLKSLQTNKAITIKDLPHLYDERLSPTEAWNKYQEVFEDLISGNASDIFFIYNRFISILNQEAAMLSLAEEISGTRGIKDSIINTSLPAMDCDINTIFQKSLKTLLSAIIYYILRQQIVSEYAIKMNSMENATKNGQKLCAELNLKYNKLRQSRITEEIIDIIGGVEALAKSS